MFQAELARLAAKAAVAQLALPGAAAWAAFAVADPLASLGLDASGRAAAMRQLALYHTTGVSVRTPESVARLSALQPACAERILLVNGQLANVSSSAEQRRFLSFTSVATLLGRAEGTCQAVELYLVDSVLAPCDVQAWIEGRYPAPPPPRSYFSLPGSPSVKGGSAAQIDLYGAYNASLYSNSRVVKVSNRGSSARPPSPALWAVFMALCAVWFI